MGRVRLASRAKEDLNALKAWTLAQFGRQRCAHYLRDLRTSFADLAEYPGMGVDRSAIRPGLRSWKQGRHVVFYVARPDGVRIARILHESMAHEECDFASEAL